MLETFKWPAIIAVTIVVLLGLDRLCLWMESRGWLYYRRIKPRSTNMGNALLELQSLLEPEKRHIVEVKKAEYHEEEDSGDPKTTGKDWANYTNGLGLEFCLLTARPS